MPDPPASSEDQDLLDQLFDRAVEQIGRGLPTDLDRVVVEQPHLRAAAEAALALARAVAPCRPGLLAPVTQEFAGFELLAELGHGATGVVYRARQSSLGRIVALKVLSPALAALPRARERFLTEARALARVSHPHIVAIHAVVETPEGCAYAMEWIDGRTLDAALTRPEADQGLVAFACRLGVAVAGALAAVHQAGLLHRDVKPANILLRQDGTPLLADFSLVRDEEQSLHTAPGHFLGTPAYASPEQLRGEAERMGPWSDVYSLGVTLYHLLARRLPFRRMGSTAALLRALETGQLVPLRRVLPRVPRDLETIVATAMDPDPARRYQSAGELLADLERFQRFEPIRARRAGPIERGVRTLRRNRRALAIAGVGSVVALVAAVLCGAWLWGRVTAPESTRRLMRDARLLLLDPRLGDRMSWLSAQGRSGYGGLPIPQVEQALSTYRQALALVPGSRSLQVEVRVVEAAHALLAHSVPAVDELAGDCPLTVATVRTLQASGAAPTLDRARLDAAGAEDRRALGLLAFVCGEERLCLEAWDGLDIGPQEVDPLVAAALGELYLAEGRSALAALRLQLAFRAFPEAGFLAVDLADALLRNGDVGAARRFVGAARVLSLHDPYESLLRVEADLCAALGDDAGAERRYQAMTDRHKAPTAHLHYARFLRAHGRTAAAIDVLRRAVALSPTARPLRQELADLVERAWGQLDRTGRVKALTMAAHGKGSDLASDLPLALAMAAGDRERKSAMEPASDSVPQAHEVSLRDLCLTLEVVAMYRSDSLGLLAADPKPLLRAALAWDARKIPQIVPGLVLRGFALSLGLLGTLFSTRAEAQAEPTHLYTFRGVSGSGFGVCVDGAGDVNGDTYPDVIVGAYHANSDTGEAWVYSGRDGTVLHHLVGSAVGDNFGTWVAGAGDVDGDGFADVVVGADQTASAGPGYVRMFAGRTGAALWTVPGNGPRHVFGTSVNSAGDVNGNGLPDVIVGATQFGSNGTGYAKVLDGRTGALIRTLSGAAVGEGFGVGVDGIGDVNGDSVPDLLVGAYTGNAGGSLSGRAVVFSGATGNQLHQITGAPGDQLGIRVRGLRGDVDGDGKPDFILGSSPRLPAPGYARVCSGASGAPIRLLNGHNSGDYLGYGIGPCGDVDGDGKVDVLVAARQDSTGPGYAEVYSSATWSVLLRVNGSTFGDAFGYLAAGVGDVNRDGIPDFVVAAAAGTAGYARVFSTRSLALTSDRHSMSAAAGGTATFTLTAGATHQNKLLFLLGSASGTAPGIPLPPVLLPLNYDAYFQITLTPGWFAGSPGFLGPGGTATVQLTIPANAATVGLQLHHAYVVIPIFFNGFDFASNAVPLTFQ